MGGRVYNSLCFFARSVALISLGLKLLSAMEVIVGNLTKRVFKEGREANSALVYSALGFLKISSVDSVSTIFPLYITITRSAISETRFKSWEINNIAIFVSC